MKHSIVISLAAMFIIAGCAKENLRNESAPQNQAVDSRTPNLVTLCHQTGNGEYIVIQVNQNAVQAHLNHGDHLPDADGDGYSAVGACTGSMDDCDDNNPEVYPGNGCEGPCGLTQEWLDASASFVVFIDTEVENCFPEGFVNGVGLLGEDAVFAVTIDYGSGPTSGIVMESCEAVVGVDISQQQFEAAQQLIRDYIADNTDLLNYCEVIGGLQSGGTTSTSTELARSKEFMDKLQESLPAKLRKNTDKY